MIPPSFAHTPPGRWRVDTARKWYDQLDTLDAVGVKLRNPNGRCEVGLEWTQVGVLVVDGDGVVYVIPCLDATTRQIGFVINQAIEAYFTPIAELGIYGGWLFRRGRWVRGVYEPVASSLTGSSHRSR